MRQNRENMLIIAPELGFPTQVFPKPKIRVLETRIGMFFRTHTSNATSAKPGRKTKKWPPTASNDLKCQNEYAYDTSTQLMQLYGRSSK